MFVLRLTALSDARCLFPPDDCHLCASVCVCVCVTNSGWALKKPMTTHRDLMSCCDVTLCLESYVMPCFGILLCHDIFYYVSPDVVSDESHSSNSVMWVLVCYGYDRHFYCMCTWLMMVFWSKSLAVTTPVFIRQQFWLFSNKFCFFFLIWDLKRLRILKEKSDITILYPRLLIFGI